MADPLLPGVRSRKSGSDYKGLTVLRDDARSVCYLKSTAGCTNEYMLLKCKLCTHQKEVSFAV